MIKILTHVFDDLEIESSVGPEISIFQRFRKVFPSLGQSVAREKLNFIEITAPHLVTKRAEVVDKLKSFRSKDFARDDYKEFLQLSILLLEGKAPSEVYVFLTCGAVHRARWMAKVIYAMKIILYKDVMISKKVNIFHDGQYDKLCSFVLFIIFVYTDYWFETPLASKGPKNDLDLTKACIRYSAANTVVSKAAVHACHLRSWYLSPELAPLVLFDPSVSLKEKGEVAEKLPKVCSSKDQDSRKESRQRLRKA